jgi:hypothetical protein
MRETHGDGISRGQFILEKSGRIEDVYDLDGTNLGQGAYGTVRRGTHRDLHLVRAIKILQNNRVDDRLNGRSRF